jgi:hypothetical protein
MEKNEVIQILSNDLTSINELSISRLKKIRITFEKDNIISVQEKICKIAKDINTLCEEINGIENDIFNKRTKINDLDLKLSSSGDTEKGISYLFDHIYLSLGDYKSIEEYYISETVKNSQYKLTTNKDGEFKQSLKKNNKYVFIIPYISLFENICWLESIDIGNENDKEIIFSNNNTYDMK